jgi:FkbM family methyltransferase
MPRLYVAPSVVRKVVGSVWDHPSNRGHRLSALARMARFQLRARLLDQPTVVPLGDHSRVLARHNDSGSFRAAYARVPDWAEMQAWKRVLRPGDTFVDVGANVGLYSIFALDLGARVIAFEPLPRNLEELAENLAINGYDAEVHPAAVGDAPGRLRLGGPDANMGHLREDGDGIEVDVTTIDAVLGDRAVAGMKVDVEGAERRVLEGARRALAERRIGLVQLEWNETSRVNFGEDRAPVAALLRSHGYRLYRPDDDGALLEVADPGYGADVFARPTEP